MENFKTKKEALTKEFQELAQIVLKADTRQKEIIGTLKFIEELEKEEPKKNEKQ